MIIDRNGWLIAHSSGTPFVTFPHRSALWAWGSVHPSPALASTSNLLASAVGRPTGSVFAIRCVIQPGSRVSVHRVVTRGLPAALRNCVRANQTVTRLEGGLPPVDLCRWQSS